jgi:glycosyltransferase involved in cell wall biosynthesis
VTVESYFISVIVPLEDDGDIVEPFAEELLAALRAGWSSYEVVLVDDASRDSTRDCALRLCARHECLRYLRLSRRSGREVALLAGMDNVIGDVIVVLQPEVDPPELLPRFAAAARETGGIAYGVSPRPAIHGFLYGLGRRLFARLASRVLEIDLPAGATLYMAFTRQALNAVNQIRDKARAVRIFGAVTGFPVERIAYAQMPRRSRPRSKSVREGLRRAVSLIVTNSTKPLRWMSLLGVGSASLCLLYVAYVFAVAIWKERVAEGWITLSLVFTGLFFLLFLILAVVCEYVGRLLEESRDRPSYFVAEERSSSVLVADATRRNVVHGST